MDRHSIAGALGAGIALLVTPLALGNDTEATRELVGVMLSHSIEMPNFHKAFQKSVQENQKLSKEEKQRIIRLVEKRTSREALEKALAPAFQKHFTAAEIRGLLAFYRTPLGKKLLANEQKLKEDIRRIGAEHAKSILDEIASQMGGKAPRAPARSGP